MSWLTVTAIDSFVMVIDGWLIADQDAPREQRHTARRFGSGANHPPEASMTPSTRGVLRHHEFAHERIVELVGLPMRGLQSRS